MSNSQAEYPTPDLADVELVDVLRVLGDPIRLQMLRVLADGAPHSKSMAEWGFDVQKSTMSHHFKTMREAGLTETLVDGRSHAIRLRREELEARFPGLVDTLVAAVSGR
jgi:DNA-binding transcriptional ArsR family regulator